MKISIFGAHYTGKTTLAKKLANETGLIYHKTDKSLEIAKEMNINSLDELEKMDMKYKWLFQMKMLNSLKESINNSIIDGNSISCIPYGKKLLQKKMTNTIKGKRIISEAIKNSKNYDFLFYLPTEFNFEKDRFRHSGNDFRMEVAKELLDNMNNYKVLTGSLEDRIQTAKYIMNLEKNPARNNHIVFEGICNSGKSTIMKMVMEKLDQEGVNYYNAERKLSPKDKTTEDDLVLWYSDLNKYKKKLIKSYIKLFSYTNEFHQIDEKVKSGKLIFSDRQKFSVIALGLGLGYDINYMYKITSNLKTAGTILFFDLPFKEGLRRARLNNKSMPSIRQNEYIQRMMSEGFKKLALIHSEVKVVDATKSKQELFEEVFKIIKNIKT